mgnify:CR=1 FL=1
MNLEEFTTRCFDSICDSLVEVERCLSKIYLTIVKTTESVGDTSHRQLHWTVLSRYLLTCAFSEPQKETNFSPNSFSVCNGPFVTLLSDSLGFKNKPTTSYRSSALLFGFRVFRDQGLEFSLHLISIW